MAFNNEYNGADFHGNPIINFAIHPLAEAPTFNIIKRGFNGQREDKIIPLQDGQTYYDTTLKQLRTWDVIDEEWKSSGGGGGADTNFANKNLTAPANRSHNFDSNSLAIKNLLSLNFGGTASVEEILVNYSSPDNLTVRKEDISNPIVIENVIAARLSINIQGSGYSDQNYPVRLDNEDDDYYYFQLQNMPGTGYVVNGSSSRLLVSREYLDFIVELANSDTTVRNVTYQVVSENGKLRLKAVSAANNTPDLQAVTEVGNTTNNEIISTSYGGVKVSPLLNGDPQLIGSIEAEETDPTIDANTFLTLSRLFGTGEGYSISLLKVIPNQTRNATPQLSIVEGPNKSGQMALLDDIVTIRAAAGQSEIQLDDAAITTILVDEYPSGGDMKIVPKFIGQIVHVKKMFDGNPLNVFADNDNNGFIDGDDYVTLINLYDCLSIQFTDIVNATVLKKLEGGNVGSAIISDTYANVSALVQSNSLVIGTIYNITDADTELYGGTSIFLKAISSNKLSTEGDGLFFNPKYNQSLEGYGIWDLFNSYNIGDNVIWGGKHWTNITGNNNNNIDNQFDLGVVNWQAIPFNNSDYNLVSDPITFDFANNLIVSRKEVEANNFVEFDLAGALKFECSYSWIGNCDGTILNPIKYFQWGNQNNVAYNKVTGNSVALIINFKGSRFIDNFLDKNCFISNICFGFNYYFVRNMLSNNSSFNGNNLQNSSGFKDNVLSNNSSVANNVMNNTSFEQNSLKNESFFDFSGGVAYSNKQIKKCIANGFNRNQNSLSINLASTIIFSDYNKELFDRPDGTPRLKYVNNSDVQLIVPISN